MQQLLLLLQSRRIEFGSVELSSVELSSVELPCIESVHILLVPVCIYCCNDTKGEEHYVMFRLKFLADSNCNWLGQAHLSVSEHCLLTSHSRLLGVITITITITITILILILTVIGITPVLFRPVIWFPYWNLWHSYQTPHSYWPTHPLQTCCQAFGEWLRVECLWESPTQSKITATASTIIREMSVCLSLCLSLCLAVCLWSSGGSSWSTPYSIQ